MKTDVPLALFDTMVLTIGERMVDECRQQGIRAVRENASTPPSVLDSRGRLLPELEYYREFVILIPEGGEQLRDTLAINIGDVRPALGICPRRAGKHSLRHRWRQAHVDRRGGPTVRHPRARRAQGLRDRLCQLDRYGLRIVTPAFMPIVGPYGSGKSIFLRQLLINLWRLHGWKFALTSFEEKVRPRFERDLIAKAEQTWTDADRARAFAELNDAGVFILAPAIRCSISTDSWTGLTSPPGCMACAL